MSTSRQVAVPGVGVNVEYNVPATMRDGTTLYADVYRPEGEGPWPVILIRLPYDKTSAENISYTDPSWYARHGSLRVRNPSFSLQSCHPSARPRGDATQCRSVRTTGRVISAISTDSE